MVPKRTKNSPFTVAELHAIQVAMEKGLSPRFLLIHGQDFEEALAYQLPIVYHSWKAYGRAEADFIYSRGVLDEYVKSIENKK